VERVPQPPPPDPELIAEGWERRFLADPERAAEAAELYRRMGLEVKLFPLSPMDFVLACGDCRSSGGEDYVVVYTRKPGAGGPAGARGGGGAAEGPGAIEV